MTSDIVKAKLRELIAEVKACEALGWSWPRASEALTAFAGAAHEALPALLSEGDAQAAEIVKLRRKVSDNAAMGERAMRFIENVAAILAPLIGTAVTVAEGHAGLSAFFGAMSAFVVALLFAERAWRADILLLRQVVAHLKDVDAALDATTSKTAPEESR